MKKTRFFMLTGASAIVALGLGFSIFSNPTFVSPVFAEEEVVETTEQITPEEEKTIVDEVKDAVTTVLNTWDIKTLFTPQNIMAFLTTLITSGFGAALLSVYVKYKKEVSVTRESIEGSIEKILPKVSEKVLSEIVDKILAPMASSVSSMEEAISVFSRCLALAQEGTPEAKLAILKELEMIKIKDESVIAKIEEAIKKAVEESQKQIDEKIKMLESMEEFQKESESAGKEEPVEEKTEVDDGTSI